MKKILAALLLAPALASAQGAIGVASGGGSGGAIPECSGAQSAFGVCLDTTTGNLIWEGATADTFEATLGFADPGADVTISVSAITGTLLSGGNSATSQAQKVYLGTSCSQWFGTTAAEYWRVGGCIGGTMNLDNRAHYYGTSIDAGLEYDTTNTPDALKAFTSTDSNAVHLSEKADKDFDFQNCSAGTSAQTNPTLCIHSANQSTTEWIEARHNQTDGVVAAGTGGVRVSAPSGLIVDDAGTKPTCDATTRGAIWYDAGGAGVLDTLEVCRKDAGDAYAWVSLF